MNGTLSLEQCATLLRQAGLRLTMQRVALLQLFSQSPIPLSVKETSERLGPRGGDQATVYRNLLALVRAGLAQVAVRADGMDRYAFIREDAEKVHLHPHFLCNRCGVVTCLPETMRVTGKVAQTWSKALNRATIQFQGVCPSCETAGKIR